MTDDDPDDGQGIDPDNYETWDKYDPSLDPPERPGDDGPTRRGDRAEPRPAVPAGLMMATIGVYSAAFNSR